MTLLIIPDWPAPSSIKSCTTTRLGGVSLAPFNSLNLGDHVDDDPQHVLTNRQIIANAAQLPSTPIWLEQVHGTDVIELDDNPSTELHIADAAYTRVAGKVCTIMTADCLPVLFYSAQGDEVAAAHAGWRGLCDGILEKTINCFSAPRSSIIAWLGPAIGPQAFEVGAEVKARFEAQDPQAASAFTAYGQKYLADIYQLARLRLSNAGVNQVYGGEYCTVSDPQHFFSYRRDKQTGRMASMIWIEPSHCKK